MPDAETMIAVIGGAIGIVGGSGGVLGLWRGWRQEHREEHHAFFASYEKSIATLQTQYQRETDAAKKQEKRQRLEAIENEYVEQQEAYRQNSALRESAPRGVLMAERPSPSQEVAAALTELLQKARPLSPALLTALDHLLRGNTLYELKRYEEALAEYNAALALRPDDPDILNNRGVTLDELKRYEESLADLNRALELRPHDPVSLSNRAAILSNLNRNEEALAACDRALQLRPDDSATLGNRGIALLRLQRYEEALASFNRALDLQPDQPPHFYNRGCLFSVTGRYEEALRELSRAIAGDEESGRRARDDEDFEGLRNDPEWGPKFKELVETEE